MVQWTEEKRKTDDDRMTAREAEKLAFLPYSSGGFHLIVENVECR